MAAVLEPSASTTTGVVQQQPQAAEESSIDDQIQVPEARFECPICLAWLRDPVVTACGHRFCRSCILSWLERENACCPVDNMKLNHSDIYPDNFTRREISNQRTRCPNITRGCLAELSPLDVEQHLLECPYRPPEVRLPENEKLRCAYVDAGCEEKFEDEPELQRHYEQNLQKHLMLVSSTLSKLRINQSTASTSSIAEQANFWDPPSKSDMQYGGASNDAQNLMRALYEKIVILEQKTREQDIIIANMSEQINSTNLTLSKMSLRYCNGCYLWYLNDFKKKLNQMHASTLVHDYSPGFYTSCNGYKLCLRINLSPRDPGYLAVLIHMMKTDHDNTLEWPFTGRITLMILHPRSPQRAIKETMMSRPELDAFKQPIQDLNPKGFGYTEFASVEELLTSGFIENNQLIVKAVVQSV